MTPVLPGLVKHNSWPVIHSRPNEELIKSGIRQAAVCNADDASLNCHLPRKAVSKDSAGIPACVGVRADVAAAVGVGVAETGDEDDDFQVVRPHRLEGVLQN